MTDIISVQSITNRIYLIRGLKVMIDRDLAELYGVETKQLKRAVRRNIDRFPSDFMFELTIEEYNFLRCQFGTLKRGKHSKYVSMAFTEQGVAMLPTLHFSNLSPQSSVLTPQSFSLHFSVLSPQPFSFYPFPHLPFSITGKPARLKLAPQPQVVSALALVNCRPPPIRSSE
jgi:hypothetical protein